MKTDTLFYQLFQAFPTLLFELIGEPIELARGYQFTSVEVKEKAFRFDGVLSPPTLDQPLYFVEVQFQARENFYRGFIAEIFLYLNQYPIVEQWGAVTLFAHKKVDPGVSPAYRELFESQRIRRIYLADLMLLSPVSIPIQIIQLILSEERETVTLARELMGKVQDDKVVTILESVLVYKFSKLTREEVFAMFSVSDLKQTWIYQDAKQEGLKQGKELGREEGKELGELHLIRRLIKRKFGEVSPTIVRQIEQLPLPKLEELGEALLDFNQLSDLESWLNQVY